MWAMIVKEFRQLRRDRRTLAMMIVMPVLLLVVFGYAASFDVSSIPTAAAGPQAAALIARLGKPFELAANQPSAGRDWAQTQLRDGKEPAAVVTSAGRQPEVLLDGSQLFTAKAALAALSAAESKAAAARAAQPGGGTQPPAGAAQQAPAPKLTVLYNPGLTTSTS